MAKTKEKVAVLSNIMVDLIVSKLRRKYDFYLPEGFDTWVQEAVDLTSGLYNERVDAVIVLLDGTEARSWKSSSEGVNRLILWKQALTALTNQITNIPIFVSTIDIRENRIKSLSERKQKYELENEWYQHVQILAETKMNVYLFDLADRIAEIGRKQFYSNKMWYISSMPYSRQGLFAVCAELDRLLNAAFSARKKIIAVDLDNTLWGGFAGEDGIDGIELSAHKEGQRFYDFQRQLLEMKNRGILLAVNSKNNPEDAETAISKHPAMLLRNEDFVIRKINWESKAVNLKAMERELNLTEGGFIFIDDNPVERETVKNLCPDVFVPEFPMDSTELITLAETIWFDYCMPLRVIDDDMKKTLMYREEEKRRHDKCGKLSLDDFISELKITVDIHSMRFEELDRVTQLCSKTNQFNVTSKRYTRSEIEEMAEDSNNAIYVVYCSDKYGDSGLVSVIILMEGERDVHIDTFLMSCRVMGRKLEYVILNELAAWYAGKRRIIGEFVPTEKNAPVKELYDRLGFELVSDESGHKIYELDVSEYRKKSFDNYDNIRFEK